MHDISLPLTTFFSEGKSTSDDGLFGTIILLLITENYLKVENITASLQFRLVHKTIESILRK